MRKHEMGLFSPIPTGVPLGSQQAHGVVLSDEHILGKSSVVHTVVSTCFETERLPLLYVAAIQYVCTYNNGSDSQEQQPL